MDNLNKNWINKYFKNIFGDFLETLRKKSSRLKIIFEEFFRSPFIKKLYNNISYRFQSSKIKTSNFLKQTIDELKNLKNIGPRTFLFIFVISVIILSLIVITIFYDVANRLDKSKYTISIPKGYGINQIADLLIEKGIIKNRYGFNIVVSTLKATKTIKAGEYAFSPSMPLVEVVLMLKHGKVISYPQVKLVIPEGSSIYNIGEILKSRKLADGDSFKYYVHQKIPKDLLEKFPFLKDVKIDSLEGYLFPDTYFIPPNITNEMLLDIMLSRFSSVVLSFWDKARNDTSYSLHEIITLASIIEKEAAVPEERRIISSVFHNRLKKGINLAADPTVKYALSFVRKPTKKVYFIDLEIDSPYNTYRYKGLPPGPICNPGIESIIAAVYPANTNYYYFVARPDGTHIFSTNWADHERAKEIVNKK